MRQVENNIKQFKSNSKQQISSCTKWPIPPKCKEVQLKIINGYYSVTGTVEIQIQGRQLCLM